MSDYEILSLMITVSILIVSILTYKDNNRR